MKNIIKIDNANFGGIVCSFYRDKDFNIYMTGEQIGQCLEYSNPLRSISNLYNKYENDLREYSVVIRLVSTDGKTYKTRLFNEQGIYMIIKFSNQPKAIKFYKAVAKILEKLRKGELARFVAHERSKEARKELTDVIRDELPDSPNKKWAYKNYTDLIYKVVIGRTAKQIRQQNNLEEGVPIKNYLTVDELKQLKKADSLVRGLLLIGWSYEDIKEFLVKQFIEKIAKK